MNDFKMKMVFIPSTFVLFVVLCGRDFVEANRGNFRDHSFSSRKSQRSINHFLPRQNLIPALGPDFLCQENSEWHEECNECFCSNGFPQCTRVLCSPDFVTKGPRCTAKSRWFQANPECSWCECRNKDPVCTPVKCPEFLGIDDTRNTISVTERPCKNTRLRNCGRPNQTPKQTQQFSQGINFNTITTRRPSFASNSMQEFRPPTRPQIATRPQIRPPTRPQFASNSAQGIKTPTGIQFPSNSAQGFKTSTRPQHAFNSAQRFNTRPQFSSISAQSSTRPQRFKSTTRPQNVFNSAHRFQSPRRPQIFRSTTTRPQNVFNSAHRFQSPRRTVIEPNSAQRFMISTRPNFNSNRMFSNVNSNQIFSGNRFNPTTTNSKRFSNMRWF